MLEEGCYKLCSPEDIESYPKFWDYHEIGAPLVLSYQQDGTHNVNWGLPLNSRMVLAGPPDGLVMSSYG